jgi:hypothetical protein
VWVSAAAAFAIMGGGGLVGVGMMRKSDNRMPLTAPVSGAPMPTVSADPSATGPSPEQLAAERPAARAKALTAALEKYAASVPEFSVAVLDRKTGQRYAFRGSERYEAASVVKVQVLACLLLEAQEDDRDLTPTELSLAKRMIRYSDNDATTALFSRLGRAPGVTRSNKRLGLTETRVSSAWGLTQTTVNDQVRLLDELVDEDGPLDPESRRLALKLMAGVDDDQDWGVPVVAKPGETAIVKNGWLPRTSEGGRWIINSVGRVTGDDLDVSIAVLSHGHRSMPGGISVVEKAAKLTRRYLEY